MADLLSARWHFDRAMAALARQGPAAALPEFITATDADPSMADAWLGRIACGDNDLTSLKHLNASREWLHRETTRIGRTLAAEIQLGPYIGITVTDASQVGLALSSALTIAGSTPRPTHCWPTVSCWTRGATISGTSWREPS